MRVATEPADVGALGAGQKADTPRPWRGQMNDVSDFPAALTEFSHIRPGDTGWRTGGLRDFFLYRDLGVAAATHGQVLAQLVRANLAPSSIGTGWHRHDAQFHIVIMLKG